MTKKTAQVELRARVLGLSGLGQEFGLRLGAEVWGLGT